MSPWTYGLFVFKISCKFTVFHRKFDLRRQVVRDFKEPWELVIDSAPTVGTSYLLLQSRDEDDPSEGYRFISMDSSNFRRGQLSLCLFEAEVAGLRYACRKENHFLQACPSITVVDFNLPEAVGAHQE